MKLELEPYNTFLDRKRQLCGDHGFNPLWMPDFLYDFQRYIVEWSLRKGRAAIFADCGLGKSPMQLVWAENVVRKTNKRVIVLTPLSVGHQTVREACKFGIHAAQCRDGKLVGTNKITVTNYERLNYFNPSDFVGAVCDESSILKNFDGATRDAIIEFMRRMPYRLLCTATASPNDYTELGNSSEALGYLGYMDMLGMFFKANNGSLHPFHAGHARRIGGTLWRFRGHAETDFWRWICSWAIACRKPSDLGFDDARFTLPKLEIRQHIVAAREKDPEYLFDMPAITLEEQRKERRRTITERCEKAAAIACSNGSPVVSWCHLNAEGDTLQQMIPDCVQVSGDDPDERKEELFRAFENGQVKRMISKPTIAGFGLNWQHCAKQTFFPSHSFEQWYQAIRRSWRYGQKKPVTIDIITSEGEKRVIDNMKRKADAADEMFSKLTRLMTQAQAIERENEFTIKPITPLWLSNTKY